MGIVEGEPDHTGLASMARAVQRLFQRGQSGAGTADHWGPERDDKASSSEPPDGKETSGTEH